MNEDLQFALIWLGIMAAVFIILALHLEFMIPIAAMTALVLAAKAK